MSRVFSLNLCFQWGDGLRVFNKPYSATQMNMSCSVCSFVTGPTIFLSVSSIGEMMASLFCIANLEVASKS